MTTARLVAIDALVRIDEGAYAHVVLPTMLRDTTLDDRDRAFATDLVYGTVRSQRRVDDLVERASSRPVRRLDPPVRAALRMGAYQLVQGVPAHAAVGETVKALVARSPRARGFANGVLRGITRLGPPYPEPVSEAIALSYPDWLVDRLTTELGAERAHAALVAMNEAAAVTLRVNPRRGNPSGVGTEIARAGGKVEAGRLVETSLVVRGIGDPARLPAVRDGRATPQDQGSQAVIAVLDPQPGERIADLAAAPGGKATAIAEQVGDEGEVVAVDADAGRVRLIEEAVERLRLPNVVCVVADGRDLPVDIGTFDRVLLDAPCSGIGVLRRRPDARWRLQPDAIPELSALQRELLASAAVLVRPGGTLVYSVCTLTREETVAIDEWAAEHLPDFTALAPPGDPWVPHGRGALLLPDTAGTDGMFVLSLTRAD